MAALENPHESDYDDESNILHAFHAAWNLLVAGYMIQTHPDLDDRWKGLHGEANNATGEVIHIGGGAYQLAQQNEVMTVPTGVKR
jgi:hypothetical protein